MIIKLNIISYCYLFSGDPQPVVNLTVLPSLTIVELKRITVICDAAAPAGASSLPPTQIQIYFGIYVVKTCGNGNSPIYQCVYSLNSFFPMLARIVSCTAENAAGQCRLNVANVTLVKGWLIIISSRTTRHFSHKVIAKYRWGIPLQNGFSSGVSLRVPKK